MKKNFIEKTILDGVPKKQKEISERIMYLALDRIFQRTYEALNDTENPKMEKVFTLGSNKEKKNAMKKYLPDFDELYIQEIIKINKELKERITKKRNVK